MKGDKIMNKLILKDNSIELIGFEMLGPEITFAFYPKGIVIFNGKREFKDFYHHCTISDDNSITDNDLLSKILTYNIKNDSIFIYSGDSYIEMNPSTKK